MTSNSSFNLPGLGHLGQSSNGGNSINTTTTNNMGNEGSVGEKKGGNGVSSSETKPVSISVRRDFSCSELTYVSQGI